MKLLEALHDVAKAEANRPGAHLWSRLRDACAADMAQLAALAVAREERAALAGTTPAAVTAATDAVLAAVDRVAPPRSAMVDAAGRPAAAPAAAPQPAARSIVITERMIDAALVASYEHAQPAPTAGTREERDAAQHAAEYQQMHAAIAAALDAAAGDR